MIVELNIPNEHPCYPDHFPDRTVVPGVVLLELVLDLCQQRGFKTQTIKSCKFLHECLPGEHLSLVIDQRSAQEWKVRVEQDQVYIRATLVG